MNFVLERVAPSSTYTIKDEEGKIIYTCKKTLFSLGDKFIIYDENNIQLAELKQTILSRTKYKLYINGTIVDEVTLFKKTPLNKYQLINKEWYIEGDITYTNYFVLNKKGEKVIEMKYNLPIDTWNIHLFQTKDKLLSILVILTILSIAQN